MFAHLTRQARQVLSLANETARGFNHDYVGTEHILLALAESGVGDVADVLATLGVDAGNLRANIEKLIQHGTQPVSRRRLPLTPRANRALEHAAEHAQIVNEKCVGPEHMLVGLLHEEEGVAAQVLSNLGLKLAELRNELLKTRLTQMKIVERAVRPVPAGTLCKRKMREELLAHLTAIYDEEHARLLDPAAALEAAATRFGAPAELAAELESALPFHERFSHFIERWVLYRAPESAAYFSLRMALHTFCLLAVCFSLVAFGVFLGYGWIEGVQIMARVFAAIVLITPPVQFAVWLAYIKMRDAMWGAFGSRKSLRRVLALDVLIGVLAAMLLLSLTAIVRLDIAAATAVLPMCGIVGFLVSLLALTLARLSGPSEIRDTHWALLEIEAA